jgi:hypothetical protein
MKLISLKKSYFAALLIPVAFGMKGADAPDPQVQPAHLSGLTARITLPDGTIRRAKIEGVGCSIAICSRVAIKGKTASDSLDGTWLDAIAAIRQTTENDAVLVLKNGMEKRISLLKDFRVLYIATENSGKEKVDLAKVKSLEFLH